MTRKLIRRALRSKTLITEGTATVNTLAVTAIMIEPAVNARHSGGVEYGSRKKSKPATKCVRTATAASPDPGHDVLLETVRVGAIKIQPTTVTSHRQGGNGHSSEM